MNYPLAISRDVLQYSTGSCRKGSSGLWVRGEDAKGWLGHRGEVGVGLLDPTARSRAH